MWSSFNSAESLAGCLQTRFVAANWWHDNYTSARTVLFATGWRFHGNLGNGALIGLGGVAGVTGGIAGGPGPPVILFYMATIHPVKVIRANNLLFLFGFDIFALFFLGVASVLNINAVVLGLVLAIPMGLGNVIGAVLFNPEKEKLYRMIAFLIITLSALSGLPLLSDRLMS